MPKYEIKPQGNSECDGWLEVIRDSEAEIAAASVRIRRLRRVIIGARAQFDAGVPFPEVDPTLDEEP